MTMPTRAAIVAALTAAAAVGLRVSTVQERTAFHRPLGEIPLVVGEWTGYVQAPFDPATLAVLGADDYLARTYVRQGGEASDVYVGFYASQRQGDTIHSPMNCLPAEGWEPQAIGRAILALDSRTPVEVNRYVVQKGFDRRLVLYWYQSHGRIVASEYWSRAYLVMDSLRFHRSDGAIVRIIASLDHGESRAEEILTDFVHALYPSLSEHLPS